VWAGDAFLTKIIQLLRILPVFPLFGDGRTRLEPVFVGDVAEAVALLAERSAPLPIYEFGGGHVYTYRELIEAIARAAAASHYIGNLSLRWRLSFSSTAGGRPPAVCRLGLPDPTRSPAAVSPQRSSAQIGENQKTFPRRARVG
jgi:nucleoside-diphosphate-sugar epimerase